MTHAPTETDPPASSRSTLPPPVEEAGLSTLEAPGSATYEPSRVLRWLYSRFFRHMKVGERWSGEVRDAAARGIVVYVIHSISVLDFLCLDYLLKRFRLPLVRFVNDLGLWILEPFGKGERRLSLRRQIPEQEALAKVVAGGESALLFLRRAPTLGERPTGQGLDLDLIKTLVEQQRKVTRPILLVPQTFVWTLRPPNKKPSVIDMLFGPSEWPGRLRVLLRFLFNYRNAMLRSGVPFDVQAFLAEHQDLTDQEAADRIRYAVLRRMERERRVTVGPAKKTAGRIREELLRSPRIHAHVAAEAERNGASIEDTRRYADKELRRMMGMMDPNAINLFQRFLQWVWTRIYDGLVVDLDGMERAREAARRGPLILLPSHKSHVDYLVLSEVLYSNGVAPPMIAAGDNLSFFPLGTFLRRCGAFFIRRSFKGRKLYAALVDAYLRKLLVEGFNVEFFMEGGRSRTGKLLPPKLGMLSMVVDAGLKLPNVDLSFVPVSIGYERIIEEGAYTREMGGGEKEKESVGGLIKTSKVLRSRYGRLYIQVGEITRLADLLTEAAALHGDTERSDQDLRPAERRALINRIAHRVTYEINQATIVTPAALVATALMTRPEPEVAHAELLERCAELLAALQRAGARIAPTVTRADPQLVPPPDRNATTESARAVLWHDSIEETLALFDDAKLVEATGEGDGRTYAIPRSRRLGLEYHTNTIVHFFVPSALIATALGAEGGRMTEEALHERVAELSRLFKYEFMYRADATLDAILSDALAMMSEAGEVTRADDEVTLIEGSLAPVYAGLLRSYFEGYRLALAAAADLPDDGAKKKAWVKQALARGARMIQSGEIAADEAVSKEKLMNAVSALHDYGFVRADSESVSRGAALEDAEAVRAFDKRITKYLSKRAPLG